MTMDRIDVKCLASGSAGNAYAIDDGESVLLLEAGLPAKKILSGFLPLLPRVEGCLITHEHGDHACGAVGLAGRGIDLYATEGTFAGMQGAVPAHRQHEIKINVQFRLGSWLVLPFEVEHDAEEPAGYLLYSLAAQEKLLFATDTYYIPNTFRDLNIVMVECNYSRDLLEDNIKAGRVPELLKARILRSHFSLDNVKSFLKANDLGECRKIYLLHLSGGNSDPERFKREIQELTGIVTTVCGKGGDACGPSPEGWG